MLNALVFESFTNHQYHTLQEDKSYKVESTNSIYFEVSQFLVIPLKISDFARKVLKVLQNIFK